MFRYFDRMAEFIYRHAYCEGDYNTCARRQLRVGGGQVPENLMPQGTKLWPDGGLPPDGFSLPGM
jgi:hypothetical protein